MSVKYFEEKTRSGISHKKFKSDFGSKILEKFGWKEGEGLGKNKSGIKETIQIKRREENIGLGKKKIKEKWNDTWWENSYNNILKNIKGDKNKKIEENSSDEEEEKLKRSRKNSERKKSLSNYSNNNKRKKSINSRKNSIGSVKSINSKKNNKKDNKKKSKREVIYLNKKKKITMIEI
jgi:Pin2-interacting protein X1